MPGGRLTARLLGRCPGQWALGEHTGAQSLTAGARERSRAPVNGKESETMGNRVRSDITRGAGVRALVLVWSLAVLAMAPPVARAADASDRHDTLTRYARHTWASFVAMTDARSGLPTD